VQVTGLKASTDNQASTVLAMFMEAISDYGIPSRLRGDRGGENRDVSILMILLRGPNRASFMWGSSTFNTRIERMWLGIGKQFARAWRAFFYRLEERHLLDRANKTHLWLLHYRTTTFQQGIEERSSRSTFLMISGMSGLRTGLRDCLL
jgi:hypothetical protein